MHTIRSAALRAWAVLAALAASHLGCQSSLVRTAEIRRYAVPPDTRSLTAVVSGAADALYALASFKVDGRELVGVPRDELVADMQTSYFDAGSAVLRGGLLQQARLGTYTLVYPYAPGQPPLRGPVELEIATTRPQAQVRIDILLPRHDGSRVLHVNLFTVSEAAPPDSSLASLAEAQAIFGQAGIQLRVDSRHTLRGTGLSDIGTLSEPWEHPGGPLARLAQLGAARASNRALNVYLVDRLPRGCDGVSLGAPGPPVPSSPYFGVVLRNDPATLGWTFAHEVAHFLGLRHVRTVTPSGRILTDQIDDTEPAGDNLMEHGTRLSPGQIEVLQRSALLQPN